MSYVDAGNGETILVQIGDGATPEVFAHDCLINAERSISITANMVTNTIPNCTDPSLPAKTVRAVESTDSSISGSGVMHSSSVKTWQDWALSGLPKNVRVKHNVAGKWQVAGSYLAESVVVTGTPKNSANVSVNLVQADLPTTSTVS